MLITAVTVCKNRLSDLKQSLPTFVLAGFDEVVLVDYGCPEGAGRWAEQNYPMVRVIHHEGDSGFNASRARNLGGYAAKGEWIFFVDADILIRSDFVSFLRKHVRANHYYRARKQEDNERVAYGSFLVCRTDFDRVSGFDEIYSGWGCEDDDIFFRLGVSGTSPVEFPEEFLSEIITPDEKRTQYSPFQVRSVQHALNYIYLTVKKQTLLLLDMPGELPLEVRRQLYESLAKKMRELSVSKEFREKGYAFTIKIGPRSLRTISPLRGTQEINLTIRLEAELEQLRER